MFEEKPEPEPHDEHQWGPEYISRRGERTRRNCEVPGCLAYRQWSPTKDKWVNHKFKK